MVSIGPYELTGELARGAMGIVYSVRDPSFERELALKVIAVDSERARRRFAREADALSRLRHPHVVSVHATGEHEGHPYLVMDLMRGGSLQDVLDRQGSFDPDLAAEMTAKLARAVAHAHALGILHRDLKPANVLISETGEPKLTDFGLAKNLELERSHLSRTGAALGSPGYWSPEQATGRLETVGPASDVYGLGATLYGLLTNQAPFEGNLGEQIVSLTARPPEPPADINPAVDLALEGIVLRCLEKEPKARYASAEQLADALEAWSRGEVARPLRRAAPAVAAGATLALLTLLVGYALSAGPEAKTPRPKIDVVAVIESAHAPREEAPAVLDDMLAAAALHMDRGEFSESLALADEALRLSPGHPPAILSRASTLSNMGRGEEALVLVGGVISSDPDRADARLIRGMLLQNLGRHAEAFSDFDAFATAFPDHAMGYWGRGMSLHARGDLAAALRDLDHALELEPANPGVFHRRGLVHRDLGNHAQALADLRNALRRTHPETADYQAIAEDTGDAERRLHYEKLLAMGLAASERGDAPAAEQILTEAITLLPELPLAHAERGEARGRAGNLEAALVDFERCTQVAPEFERGWFDHAMACFHSSRYAEAVRSFGEVTRLSPTHGEAHFMRGLARLESRHTVGLVVVDMRQAVKHLEPGGQQYRQAQDVLTQITGADPNAPTSPIDITPPNIGR